MRLVDLSLVLVFLVSSASVTISAQESDNSKVSLEERVFVASKIFASIPIYFAHWQNIPGFNLDDAYKNYLAKALVSSDRRDFDLASMEFVASLQNGHTGFWDKWLTEHYARGPGFDARPFGKEWIVTGSSISVLNPGDIIQRIDGKPIEEFYRLKERWLSGSSDRERRQMLFYQSYLFPETFTLTLDGGRSVPIDRLHMVFDKDHEEPAKPSLKSGIEYLRITSFDDPKVEADAIDYVRQHKDAHTFIIDVRGNGGGSTPEGLIKALMDRSYREFSVETPLTIGVLRSYQELAKWPGLPTETRKYVEDLSELSYRSRLISDGAVKQPQQPVFTGTLVILVDPWCASACEDFVEPFKDNHRATLIGESTQGSTGQPYYYDFGNGMSFRIGTKRVYFPDGSAFEGIGVKPDIEVPLTRDDLKSGRDAVLLKAGQMADGNR